MCIRDRFHIGHLNILKRARLECDHLIVGVTTDELCESAKNQKPFIPFQERMDLVEAVKYVDEVVPQTSYDKIEAWNNLKFDKMFVGDDWKGTDQWNQIEEDFTPHGVEIVYFPYTTHTSNLSVSASSSNTASTVSVVDGSTITWRITDTFTSDDFTAMSAETQSESSAVDCDPPTTVSTSFGSCSGTSKTSTISITSGSGEPTYVKVEYKIDSGAYQVASANLTVTSFATDTSLSVSVEEGTTITWRITDSLDSGDFTNMSVETQATSSTFTCTVSEQTLSLIHI